MAVKLQLGNADLEAGAWEPKNGVANWMLACTDCNRGVNGKLSCNIAIVVHTIHILGVVA